MDLNKTIRSGNFGFGEGYPCQVVAEIGPNHNGNQERAALLISNAAKFGCDGVKLQYRNAEAELFDRETKSYYFNKSRYAFIQEVQEFPDTIHKELRQLASDLGLFYVLSVMSADLVDNVIDIGPDLIKVPSGEVNNPWLLEKVAVSGLPVITSSGMSSLAEIDTMIDLLSGLTSDVILLHCTSEYPTKLKEMNLRTMQLLSERYQCAIGLSDHSRNIEFVAGSVAMGGKLIEVHFTDDKTSDGPDHHVSLENGELQELVELVRKWETCLGTKDKYLGPHVSEVRSTFTNSIVARKTIQPGECLSRDNLCLKKPGTGLPAEQLTLVLKSIAIREILENTPVRLTDIKAQV